MSGGSGGNGTSGMGCGNGCYPINDRSGTLVIDQHIGDNFTIYHGDNVEVIEGMKDDSISLVVTSIPFPMMYAYSNTSRDIGNTSGISEMLEHFRYLSAPDRLQRVVKPGRMVCIHLTNIPSFKHADGFIGRKDFRGDIIRLMESQNWIYHTEILIDKCPQVRAQRTKDRGLLFKSLANDSSVMSPVMPDYMLMFRKHGENADPIRAGRSEKYKNSGGWITQDEWIEWAAAVWYRKTDGYKGGIKETDVLNVKVARDPSSDRHLCPLQLGVIERCIKLWSSPGETVFDPFSGIGSTGYKAIQLDRRYVGIELNEGFYKQSVKYLRKVEDCKSKQGNLNFEDDEADEEADEADEAIGMDVE